METPSSNALIYAILALNSEVALQQEYLESPDVPSEDLDEEGETLEDMEQAFMEFVELYKKRCQSDRELPDINQLLSEVL
jgi:RecB family exonuclease